MLRRLLDLGLANALQLLLDVYQSFVHAPVVWACEQLGLRPPPWWVVDVTLLWLLIGGIVLRSAWSIRIACMKDKVYVNTEHGLWVDSMFEKGHMLVPFVLVAVLGWPFMVVVLLEAPHIYKDKGTGHLDVWPSRISTGKIRDAYIYLFDTRVVLATQAVTAIACVAAWVVINLLLPQ